MAKSAALVFTNWSLLFCVLYATQLMNVTTRKNAFSSGLDSLLMSFFCFYRCILTNEEKSLYLLRLFDFHSKILNESWSFQYILLHQQIPDLFYSTCTLINDLIWNGKFATLTTFSDGFLATTPPQMLTLLRCPLSFKELMFCVLSKTKLIPLHIYYSVSVKCLY